MKNFILKKKIIFICVFICVFVLIGIIPFNGKTSIITGAFNKDYKDSSGIDYNLYFYRNLSNADNTYDMISYHYTPGCENGVNSDQSNATICSQCVKETTFDIPDNWTRDGYVLAGWSPVRNSTEPIYPVVAYPDECHNWQTIAGSNKLYAVWKKVDPKYGNVVFIGDSYVNSTQWPTKLANAMGLNYSYTLIHGPGTGLLAQTPQVGKLKEMSSTMDFSSYIAVADKIIGNNDDVKLIVILGGYNDKDFAKADIESAISTLYNVTTERFRNAKIAVGMVGTDFKHSSIQQRLIQNVHPGYSKIDSYSKGYYITTTDNSGTYSLSEGLKWFGEDGANMTNGCYPSNITSSCYYRLDVAAPNTYVEEPTGIHTVHPTPAAADYFVGWVKTYIDNNMSFSSTINYDYNSLSSLSVSGYSLNKQFKSDEYTYSITVPDTVSSINISAEAINSTAQITGAGNCTISGSSPKCQVVVSNKEVNNKIYTINVNVESTSHPAGEAQISSLDFSCRKGNGDYYTIELDDNFSPNDQNYTAKTPDFCAGQTVTVTYKFAYEDSARSELFTMGNNGYTWQKTADNGSTQKNYSVKFNIVSTVSTIKSISFSSGTLNTNFNSYNTEYTLTVPEAVSTITVTYVRTDDNKTYTNTLTNLSPGTNTCKLKIISAFGEEYSTTYNFTINIAGGGGGTGNENTIIINTYGVQTTVSKFKSQNSDVTKVMNKNKLEKGTSNLIVTGDYIIKGGQEYRVVIIGDVDGNGKINTTDFAKIWKHMDRADSFTFTDELELLAADVDESGAVKTSDYSKLWKMIQR